MEVERVLDDTDFCGDIEELQCENAKYKPRGYQYEMLQYIIKQNTIVYLPTGSGKTYISILAMQHFAKHLELSGKVKQLFVYLEEYIQKNYDDEMKCLIFTHKRHSAKCLYHILKLYALENPLFKLRSDFMVGNQNKIPESIEGILETKWSRRAMERFRKNEINCLVATSVLEEGIDLQTCNLVISFDFPLTLRSYIQSKGRARCDISEYVLMIPKNEDAKYLDKLRTYKEIDEELKKYLIGKTIHRQIPLKEDVESELFQHDIKPFFSRSGAKLEVISAVSLLNRY